MISYVRNNKPWTEGTIARFKEEVASKSIERRQMICEIETARLVVIAADAAALKSMEAARKKADLILAKQNPKKRLIHSVIRRRTKAD